MDTYLSTQIKDLIQAVHYRPAVSLIMPFEPKMKDKAELSKRFKFAYDRIKKDISKNYNDELADLVLTKLKNLIQSLNYSSYKKTVAIFVSPVFEKVLYLDIPVEERIIVDESFEIRDLVFAKKETQEFLLVSINAKSSKTYYVDKGKFKTIKIDLAEYAESLQGDLPDRVSNFSDPSEQKEFQLKKFLYYSDRGLEALLKAYPLPLFVMGPQKVLGYFKLITHNSKNIVGYIPGNFSDLSSGELAQVIEPHVQDWKKVHRKALLQQMEHAVSAGKLATGINEVWKQVNHRRGKLLIVEKDYRPSAEHAPNKDEIVELKDPYNNFSYIRDAVDDMIETILENGGDVEFVEEGTLSEFGHIVLILYY